MVLKALQEFYAMCEFIITCDSEIGRVQTKKRERREGRECCDRADANKARGTVSRKT